MFQSHSRRSLCLWPVRGSHHFVRSSRFFSSKYDGGKDAEELDAARKWYTTFKEDSIPTKIAVTEFSKASGSGGQKTNKTSSKATTVWPIDSVKAHVPHVLHAKLLDSRYYVSSSDSFTIQCDAHRNRSQNKDETHQRLNDEIRQIYKSVVPGVTSPLQSRKVEQLKKAENTARLRIKKLHSDKKTARKSGGRTEF
ncbi:hypothetical protein D0Z07_7012 [Hyphodiscus hymeniophilus]|uniref:Prokaryotic-type class I peptide chain release factors domain-containing protein n=1 Tax=Hyphodiscus hymeniophilus TaxID=353542 RepID=A0A9P6VGB4_9HELO|nr:hypothetical protein D0Z07_7012 [Hyphodiscus hymeniophilus]